MEWQSFTREEAEDICEDFEDLIGTKFSDENSALLKIDTVAVGPYYEDDIRVFAGKYMETKDAAASMIFYQGNDFDIFVFAYDVDDRQVCRYWSIRSFIEMQGITYKFPSKHM